jgi:hypothetical protein
MKKLSILFIILLSIGCSNDTNENPLPDTPSNLKEVNISVSLPDGSSMNTSELTVSSIISDETLLTDGEGVVELIPSNTFELTYATNSNGNILLMGFLNPIQTNQFELSSTTTAISLAMLHPWIMHLSTQAKQEAYNEISLLPEFDLYHQTIVAAINSGEVDPLASQNMINAILEFQNVILRDVVIERTPLSMEAGNQMVKVQNKASSLAYSLQLYDTDYQPIGTENLLDGKSVEIFSFYDLANIFNGTFDFTNTPTVQFPIPSQDQTYIVRADAWSGNARWKNGAQIVSSILGIVFPYVSELVEDSECAVALGSHFMSFANTIIQESINNELTPYQTIERSIILLENLVEEYADILGDCGGIEVNKEFLRKLLKKLNLVNTVIGIGNSGSQLFFSILDIARFDSEIEFCFVKNGSEVEYCFTNNILTDLATIRLIREVNGLDISDPRWTTTDEAIASSFLDTQFAFVVEDDRVVSMRYNSVGITIIPPEIENLTELSVLHFFNNNIANVPSSIGNLSKLTDLDLEFNAISSIPSSIGNLSNLVNLDLDNNNLLEVPSTLENLSSLTNLGIDSNNLTSIPGSLGNLPNLQVLNIQDNNLTSIPSNIGNLSTLVIFRILNNPNLNCLPQSVWDLTNTGTGIFYAGTDISGFQDIDCTD